MSDVVWGERRRSNPGRPRIATDPHTSLRAEPGEAAPAPEAALPSVAPGRATGSAPSALSVRPPIVVPGRDASRGSRWIESDDRADFSTLLLLFTVLRRGWTPRSGPAESRRCLIANISPDRKCVSAPPGRPLPARPSRIALGRVT